MAEAPVDLGPMPAITTHDPPTATSSICRRKDLANRAGLYAEADAQQERYISHFAIRTMRP